MGDPPPHENVNPALTTEDYLALVAAYRRIEESHGYSDCNAARYDYLIENDISPWLYRATLHDWDQWR